MIWDIDADVTVNIAFSNGATRAGRIVRVLCEKNVHPILDRAAVRAIYMDSEYTSFPLINYFLVDEFSDTDVIMCLKRNKRVDLLATEVIELARQGLTARKRLNAAGDNETGFLAPLQQVADSGITPAQRKLNLYNGEWNHSVDPLFTECAY